MEFKTEEMDIDTEKINANNQWYEKKEFAESSIILCNSMHVPRYAYK